MTAQYVDGSVLLKIALGPRRALPSGDILVSSELTRVEVFQALNRLRALRQITEALANKKRSELRALLSALHLFPVGDEVLERAETPYPFGVRAVHAVHVATAEIVRIESPELEVFTHDPELAAAAAHRGFTVGGADVGRH